MLSNVLTAGIRVYLTDSVHPCSIGESSLYCSKVQENSTEANDSHTPMFNDAPGTSWVFSMCSVDKQKSVCFPETR